MTSNCHCRSRPTWLLPLLPPALAALRSTGWGSGRAPPEGTAATGSERHREDASAILCQALAAVSLFHQGGCGAGSRPARPAGSPEARFGPAVAPGFAASVSGCSRTGLVSAARSCPSGCAAQRRDLRCECAVLGWPRSGGERWHPSK